MNTNISALYPVKMDTNNLFITRYLTIDKYKQLVEKKELFCPTVSKFDDKYEGLIFKKEIEDIARWSNELCNYAINPECEIKQFIEENKRICQEKLKDINPIIENIEQNKKIICVTCWLDKYSEDAGMWERYAKKEGVLIAIRAIELLKLLNHDENKKLTDSALLSRIIYCNTEKNIIKEKPYVKFAEGCEIIKSKMDPNRYYYDIDNTIIREQESPIYWEQHYRKIIEAERATSKIPFEQKAGKLYVCPSDKNKKSAYDVPYQNFIDRGKQDKLVNSLLSSPFFPYIFKDVAYESEKEIRLLIKPNNHHVGQRGIQLKIPDLNNFIIKVIATKNVLEETINLSKKAGILQNKIFQSSHF